MIRADRWSPSDGFSLEPNALRTVKEVDRNVALTAGPGAGKTELLAQRADFLFRTGACRYPKRILAIAFKVDASHNLKARVRKRCGPEMASRLDSYTFHGFAKRIIDRFRLALTGSDALDADYSIGPQRIQNRAITFADMVPLAVTILENSIIARNAIRQAYTHVFLDEFQDCTKAQYQLITTCFLETRSTLTAVGDTKQRIMGWAGALEGIFEGYARDFDALPYNLYQNFRSQPRLRRVQNAMVRVMDPSGAVEDSKIPGEEGTVEIRQFSNDNSEAEFIASEIRDLIDNQGIEPSEIAILVSKQQNLYCEKLRAAFNTSKIPFREEDSTQDLAAEPVVTLIVDFFLVIGGGTQPAAYRRLLDTLVFHGGLDEEAEYQSRLKLDRFIDKSRIKVKGRLSDLTEKTHIEGLVTESIKVVGRDFLVRLSSDYAHGSRLDELITAAIDRAHELLKDGAELGNALACFAGHTAVRIMSIHKSKSLEFDTVVVLGVEKETFWGKLDAERSAYFVAISRAKRRLLLTTSDFAQDPRRHHRVGI